MGVNVIEAQPVIEPIHDDERRHVDRVEPVQEEHKPILSNEASYRSIINTRSDDRTWRVMVNYLAHINTH